MPGGALEVIAAGALDGVEHVFGLHCDPTIDVGAGRACGSGRSPAPPTRSTVRLTGRGGHTSRPHLTEDLTYALGKLVTELPGSAVPPAGPAGRRQPGLGRRPRRLGQERHPGLRRGRRHRCGCSTPSPGRTPRTWSAS